MEKNSTDRNLTYFDRIRCMLVAEFGLEREDISLEASLRGSLGLDSMDSAQLVLELEDLFGIEIPDDEADKIFTVGDAVRYAEEHCDPQSHVA